MHRYGLAGLLSTGLLLLGGLLGYGSVILAANPPAAAPVSGSAPYAGPSWNPMSGGCCAHGMHGHYGWRAAANPALENSDFPIPSTPDTLAQEVSFLRDVQPIFDARCITCHGGTQGLYLNSYEHVMAGGWHGAIVVPGNPDASRLIRYVQSGYMPYGGPPLTASQIALLITWV